MQREGVSSDGTDAGRSLLIIGGAGGVGSIAIPLAKKLGGCASSPRRRAPSRRRELFPDCFWLVTSWSQEQMPAEQLLEHYRQRGTTEGHFGELMDVLAPALSSSPRAKSLYRGQPPQQTGPSVDSFAINEVHLILNALPSFPPL